MIAIRFAFVVAAALFLVPEDALAIGGRGGGGRGGGMRGGGGRPSMGGGSRGGFSGGARPNISAPRPAARPAARPTAPPQYNRPSPSRPNVSRPSGGANFNRPTTRPSGGLRPSLPNPPSTRPSIPTRPSPLPNQRPNQRPSTSLPGFSNRPSTGLPSTGRPGGGVGNRPSLPNPPTAGNRPGSRPGNTRPTLPSAPGAGRPGNARPSPGAVGDFLGFDKPLRPGGPGDVATRPGNRLPGNRPDRPTALPGNTGRPGIANRPGADNRPWKGGRPDFGNRPNVGNGWSNNNVINRRPTWANIDNSVNVRINNQWNRAFARPGWRNTTVARRNYWRGWGDGVRHGWRHYHRYGSWYNGAWWRRHPHGLGGWHYHYWRHRYGWRYWWTVPTWAACNNWFVWSGTSSWSEPVYYDYGADGNVVYQDNSVYVGGTEIATAEEFAITAMDLATVEPPETEEQAEETEWLPLGTFTVSTDEQDTDPQMTVQLAVSKDGVVAGTLYNIETDEAQAIQGAVDRETQRVAIRIGESETLVAETGLYNLTQDEAPVLVHFGSEKTENYLLVRLDEPTDEPTDGPTGEPAEEPTE